jgi:hypothetical protein
MKAAGSGDKGRKATFPPALNVVARVVASRTLVEEGQEGKQRLSNPVGWGMCVGGVKGSEDACW